MRDPFTGKVLEEALQRAQAVVVLMKPDDEARLHADLHDEHEQEYELNLTDWLDATWQATTVSAPSTTPKWPGNGPPPPTCCQDRPPSHRRPQRAPQRTEGSVRRSRTAALDLPHCQRLWRDENCSHLLRRYTGTRLGDRG